jgi:hypothetical protein
MHLKPGLSPTTGEIQVTERGVIRFKCKISIKTFAPHTDFNILVIYTDHQLNLFANDFDDGFVRTQTPTIATDSDDKSPGIFVDTGYLVP